ncbi:MAG: cytochrome b N-terminal domain-containing protein [Pirellulales bacterium]|nr:cytochrome b N-terminal domain-containing protein [Pirellulales bacterium]
MNAISRWLDDRTGLLRGWRAFHEATVPGRACLCRSLPFVLGFAFFVQVVTGLFILMHYSAGAQSAWESIYHLKYNVPGGWVLLAVHHYMGQAVLVLVGLYLIGMILSRAYRAPREFVFWTVLLLGLLTLGLLLTGDLLAWDANSQSSTQVRVGFLKMLPGVGSELYKLAAGGPAFGHLTLTRFLALHTVVLGGGFFVLLLLRAWFARRANMSEAAPSKSSSCPVGSASGSKSPSRAYYWPGQLLWNVIGCLILLGVVGLLTVSHGTTGPEVGVELGAPADATEFYNAARPEWAFMGLYGFTKVFAEVWPDTSQAVAVFVVPTGLIVLFLLMPFTGRLMIGHVFNVALLIVLLGGDAWLTYRVIAEDRANEEHQAALAQGRCDAARVHTLIEGRGGMPVTGALTLLKEDPKTQGARLFKQHCASCHPYVGQTDQDIPSQDPSASNLFGYGTRKWVAGWLDPKQIAGPDYFGKTAFARGKMVGHVKELYSDLEEEDKEDRDTIVMALSAEAGLTCQRAMDKKDAERIAEGREMILDECTDCHRFHDKGSLGAPPDLTGYGSREWTIAILSDPAHGRFYGERNDRMPSYAPADPNKRVLSAQEIELLTDWLRGDWYEPEAKEQP